MEKRKKTSPHVINNAGINIAGNVDHSLIVEGDHNTVYFSTNQTPDISYRYQLPPVPEDFTGRENEINDILNKIRLQKMSKFCLQGMGGIGKTTLALKIASLLEEQFPDAQIFLDMHGLNKGPKLNYIQAMTHVILSFHPNINLPNDIQQIIGLFRSVLKSKKVILVFDNVYGGEQVYQLAVDGCFMIITSRSQFVLPGFDVIKLKKVTPKDARNFIVRTAPRVSARVADEIAKLLDYLPLALRISASTLATRTDVSLNSYLHDLRILRAAGPGDYFEFDADSNSTESGEFHGNKQRMTEVDSSIDLSFKILNDNVKKAFCLLGILSVPFDLPLLYALFGANTRSLGIPDDALKFNVRETDAIVGELVQLSLLEYDGLSSMYYLHNLIFSFALDHFFENNDENDFYLGLKRVGFYLLEKTDSKDYQGKVKNSGFDKGVSAHLTSIRIMIDLYFSDGFKNDAGFDDFYASLVLESRHAEAKFNQNENKAILHELITLEVEHLQVAEKLGSRNDIINYSLSLANACFKVDDYWESENYCRRYYEILSGQAYHDKFENIIFLNATYLLGRINYKLAVTYFAYEVYIINRARGISALYYFEKVLYCLKTMDHLENFTKLSEAFCNLMLGDLSLALGDGFGAVDYYLCAISDIPSLQAYDSWLLPTIYCNVGDALGLLGESLLALEWYERAYSTFVIANNNKGLYLRIGWGFIKYGNSQKGRSIWELIQSESPHYIKIMRYLETDSLFVRAKQH